MNEYVKQAKVFLSSCNATMEIKATGLETPNWDGKLHCTYDCTIKTPRGEMMVHFYDSLKNTETLTMSDKVWYEKTYHKPYEFADWRTVARQHHSAKIEAQPTEYDILACLQKYDVGSMDDFFTEFGYEIKSTKDMTDFISTYNAVVKEYSDVCRCFTPEQIEAMQEIQ